MKWCTAKASLINKMPGDEWQKFANLRLLYAYMWGHPAANCSSWAASLRRRTSGGTTLVLTGTKPKGQYQQGFRLLKDLNALYPSEPALYAHNFSPQGFEWIDFEDSTTVRCRGCAREAARKKT